MSDPVEAFKNLPIFTKYWLGLTAGLSLLARFQVFDPMLLIITSEAIFSKFQVSC